MTPDVFGTPQNVFTPETINVFRELGIDPVGKSREQINAEIDSVIAREQRRLVFDPTDPLDYIAGGLGLTGLGAGIGAGIKTARTSKKLVGLTEKLQKLKNLKSLVDVRTPTGIISTTIPTAIGVRAISGAGDTSPDQIQAAIDALKEPTRSIGKTPSSTGVGAAEDSAETQDKDTTDIDDTVDQGEDDGASQETVKTTADVGVPRFVDPSRMLDFARNVSLGLLQEGQLGGGGLGAGLAIGTQLAVTERQKKDLLAAQQKREEELLQKELDAKIEIEKLKGSQDLQGYQDSLIKLNEQSSEIEGLDTTAGLFAEAQNLLRTGDATGFVPLVSSFTAKVQRFFGRNPELTQREQAVIILEAIANGNVQEITGEPEGARISDADRRIARELVGNLKDPLVDAESALERIDIQLNDIATRRSASVDNFNILALGLPYQDVMKYSPKTTPLPGMASSAQTIPLAGPR